MSAFLVDGLLVDSPATGDELASWLQGRPFDQVVNTHHHEDHAGNAALAKRLSPTIRAPAATARLLNNGYPVESFGSSIVEHEWACCRSAGDAIFEVVELQRAMTAGGWVEILRAKLRHRRL